jgi:GDSL-like protein
MKKIILFGDSIFNGYRNGQNTNLVTNLFQQALINYAQVENISKSGATTVEGVDYLEQISPEHDLVVVEYGNNDAATAWGISPESYEKNLAQILSAVGKAIVVGLCNPNPESDIFHIMVLKDSIFLTISPKKSQRHMVHNLWIFYLQ